MKLCVIDFETANRHFASACSIGIIVVEEGEVLHEASYPIRPHAKYAYFDEFNSSIHGIRYTDVEYELEFDEIYPKIRNFGANISTIEYYESSHEEINNFVDSFPSLTEKEIRRKIAEITNNNEYLIEEINIEEHFNQKQINMQNKVFEKCEVAAIKEINQLSEIKKEEYEEAIKNKLIADLMASDYDVLEKLKNKKTK